MVPGAEVVLIVEKQFFQTRPGDIGQIQLHLGGGGGSLAAFGDVLLPRAGGLDHLVDGAVTALEEFFAEAEGEVVDDFGFLVGEEFLVISTGGKEAGRIFWWGHGGGEE